MTSITLYSTKLADSAATTPRHKTENIAVYTVTNTVNKIKITCLKRHRISILATKENKGGRITKEARLSAVHWACSQVCQGSGYRKTVPSNEEGNDEDVRSRFICVLSQDKLWVSSKIILALSLLSERRLNSENGISIVFSHYLPILDVLRVAIKSNGMRFFEYNETMSISERSAAIKSFKRCECCPTMLMQLSSEVDDLNLDIADTIFALRILRTYLHKYFGALRSEIRFLQLLPAFWHIFESLEVSTAWCKSESTAKNILHALYQKVNLWNEAGQDL